jgi:hypothetical protein
MNTERGLVQRHSVGQHERQSVKGSPAYDSSAKPDRAHELDVYRHYGRRGYWLDDARRNEAGSLP